MRKLNTHSLERLQELSPHYLVKLPDEFLQVKDGRVQILDLPREAFKGERADEFRRRLCFLPGEDFAIAIAIGVPADTKAAHPVHDGHISYID